MKLSGLLLAGFALGTVAAVAQDIDIWTKTVNNDSNGVWNVQPDKPKAKYFEVKGIPGEHAFRIKANKGANPWDVQASSPVQGAINQGDVVMLMYYARAEEAAEGGSSLSARVQLAGAPYTSTLDFTTPITGEWKSYCAHRVATATLPEKKGSVSIHLATAKQVIELGPVFVFNFGKGFDQAKLKGCDG
ncbi:MAG TPA: hypothetical protein VK624_02980 [Steroidobacteraceae bacterium]|nr:hypothetical protein [Steroidobacteraceae bacterium]